MYMQVMKRPRQKRANSLWPSWLIMHMGAAMFKRTHFFTVLFSLTVVMTCTTPVITNGGESGQDWYCSEPETHAQYEKHLKRHLDHSVEAITDTLDKIYSDPTLSKEEKKKKMLAVLDNHLSKMKTGMGD